MNSGIAVDSKLYDAFKMHEPNSYTIWYIKCDDKFD